MIPVRSLPARFALRLPSKALYTSLLRFLSLHVNSASFVCITCLLSCHLARPSSARSRSLEVAAKVFLLPHRFEQAHLWIRHPLHLYAPHLTSPSRPALPLLLTPSPHLISAPDTASSMSFLVRVAALVALLHLALPVLAHIELKSPPGEFVFRVEASTDI